MGWCMGSNLKLFFWQKEFPVRSFHRIFILLSLVTYIAGRLIDPGPIWIRSLIESLVYKFNLDLIHQISLINTSTPNFWYGSGFALQIQLLFVFPLAWIFAIWSSFISEIDSKEYNRFYNKIDFDNYQLKDLIFGIVALCIILSIAYFPFNGTEIIEYKNTGGFHNKICSDSLSSSIFFTFIGYVLIAFYTFQMLIIKNGLKTLFMKGV